LNFEITAIVADEGFAAQVEQMFEDDFAHSKPIEPNEYEGKSFWFQLSVRLARLASPIL